MRKKIVPNQTKDVIKGTKNVIKGTKNVFEWKLCPKWQHHCFMFFWSQYGTLYVILWLCYGLLWPFVVFDIANYRFDWTRIVFSRGNRSKFIWSLSSHYLQHNQIYNLLLPYKTSRLSRWKSGTFFLCANPLHVFPIFQFFLKTLAAWILVV